MTPAELLSCNGSRAWVARMTALLPVADPVAVGEQVWWSLGPDDWREALAAHPRIGDRPPPGTQEQREQSAVSTASDQVLADIAAGNLAYEQRFGTTYVVRASGRSAEQMLALLRQRLANDPATEIRVAAGQQWEITALRLRALLAG